MTREASEVTQQIGTELLRQLDSLTTTVTEQLMDAVDVPSGDALIVPLRASIRAALENYAMLLIRRQPVDAATITPEMSYFARLTARRGVPLSTLVMMYHRAHNIVEQSLLSIVASLFSDRPSSSLLGILATIRDWSNQFILRMQEQISEVYLDEAERLRTPGDAGRLALVQSVLDGTESPVEIGGHRLGGRHIAVVVWVRDPGTSSATLASGCRRLAEVIGAATPPLIVFPSSTEAWMWCVPDAASGDIALGEGLTAVIGPVAEGPDGFTVSHRHALAYQRLHHTIQSDAAVWRSTDPGIMTAAAFSDRLGLARDIVSVTLGELAVDDEYSRVLRETARSFLLYGTAGAADEMIAHRNTVAYRLNKFREAHGQDALSSPDVHLALELAHWFGSRVLAD